MKGKSYPAGCTVPRADLRYLPILHYDSKGNEHTGAIVCNRLIADDLAYIFRKLYEARYPIERVQPIDEYDADDEQSMRHNNTSCFCYRTVAGSKKLSKHALGMAIDINTLYNPCVRMRKGKQIVQPSTAGKYADRSKSFAYKIAKDDLLCRLFKSRGFKWGGDWATVKDYQHFEK